MSKLARRDGWQNLVTGLGDVFKDKKMSATPQGEFLSQMYAEWLWRSDDMAARIVEKIPEDALRRGFLFHVQQDDVARPEPMPDNPDAIDGIKPIPSEGLVPPEAEARPLGPADVRSDNVTDPTLATEGQDEGAQSKEIEEAVMLRHKQLKTAAMVKLCAKYERAYGGGAILLGTVDSSPGKSKNVLARPLDLKYIAELRFLSVFTPMELVPYRYFGDPLAANYGEVELWTLVPKSKGLSPRSSVMRVHSSRLIVFGGIRTSRFMVEVQRGFGDSVLNRCINHVRNFSTAYDSSATLIHDFSQAVWKMKNLAETLQSDDSGLVQKRVQAMSFSRSVLNAMVIDSEEEFERKQTPMSGLPELLDHMAKRLAASAGFPISMLMGESPAGLNATGQADRDWYNENVAMLQGGNLQMAIERITEVELASTEGATKGDVPDNWAISFPDLEQPSETEMADIRLKISQADGAYIDRGVLQPEEVAQSRFGGAKFSMETQLNADIREAAKGMLDDKAQQEADNTEFNNSLAMAAAKNPPPAMGGKVAPKGKKPFDKK